MNHLAVAKIDTDVMNWIPRKYEVTWRDSGGRNVIEAGVLGSRGPRNSNTGDSPRIGGETRAVERISRRFSAERVTNTQPRKGLP